MLFFLKRIVRKPVPGIITAVCMAVITLLICLLNAGEAELIRRIDETYTEIKVECAVTNLTGTGDDNLNITYRAVNLFLEDPRYGSIVSEVSFLDYLENVRIRSNCNGKVGNETVTISGLNDITIARELRPEEETFISWADGYDASVFKGSAPVCVVPESLYSGEEEMEITFVHMYEKDRTDTVTLRVAGTYRGFKNNVYCPWEVAAEEEIKLEGYIHADALNAVFRDNYRIDEFREKCASQYFAEVDPKGAPAGTGNSSYRYALDIYDDVLERTIRGLETNKTVFAVCGMLTIAVSIGVGFVIGSIISKRNEKIFALKLVMGSEKRTIWAEVICELALFSLIGIAAAIAVSYAVTGYSPPWITVAASFAAEIVGITVVVVSVLNRDVLSLSGRKE